MRTCPYCDALQSPEARFCRSCGRLLPEQRSPMTEPSPPRPWQCTAEIVAIASP
ncbi:MAG: hypothetical protein K6T87_21760, partial [Roseiflexus sp.]|uniref:zinc ribbon domain-containing protein n=1 Tax=Roseiflexus sp. TaxID=2562120 RepID=UPI0034583F52|nr:hypothetical protein [Roseiflexus sp.]